MTAAAVLANPDIDAVLICSSTDTHAAFIEEAAQAGKHIFCEKPIAHRPGRRSTRRWPRWRRPA